MKKNIFAMFMLVSVLIAFFPSISNAAGLVPCGGTGQEMCTLCHFIVGIKGIIDYGFTIMVVVGLAMLVIAGVVYIVSAGNEGMMTTAKSLMKNALIGFALILGAWWIVSTIMWVMGANAKLGVERMPGTWNTFTCSTTRTTK